MACRTLYWVHRACRRASRASRHPDVDGGQHLCERDVRVWDVRSRNAVLVDVVGECCWHRRRHGAARRRPGCGPIISMFGDDVVVRRDLVLHVLGIGHHVEVGHLGCRFEYAGPVWVVTSRYKGRPETGVGLEACQHTSPSVTCGSCVFRRPTEMTLARLGDAVPLRARSEGTICIGTVQSDIKRGRQVY